MLICGWIPEFAERPVAFLIPGTQWIAPDATGIYAELERFDMPVHHPEIGFRILVVAQVFRIFPEPGLSPVEFVESVDKKRPAIFENEHGFGGRITFRDLPPNSLFAPR